MHSKLHQTFSTLLKVIESEHKGFLNECAQNIVKLGSGNRVREVFNTLQTLRRGNYLWLFKAREDWTLEL